jgi:DNA-binding MarR family transcriptional regulator
MFCVPCSTFEVPLAISRCNDYYADMPAVILRELRQTRPFGSLEEEILVGVQLAAHRLLAPWARILAEQADLSPPQYNLLRILRGAGPSGRTCTEIAERLITRDPDVTRLTERLVRRGLARREADAADRRVARIRITARGRAVLRDLDPVVAELPRRLLKGLSRRDLRSFHARLEAVIASATHANVQGREEASYAEG